MEVSRNELVNHKLDNEDDVKDNKNIYKYNNITKLHVDMKQEEIKYDKVYSKYRKSNRICTGVTVGSNFIATACSMAALTTALTVVGVPVAVPLGVIGGISYVTSIVCVAINKKIESKMRKHKAIVSLAKNKVMTLNKAIILAMDDNKITVEEYNMLCGIVEDYFSQKEQLRKRKVDIKKIMGKAEQDMRRKLTEYLKS